MSSPIYVTQTQMNLILTAVEHGFRQAEKGNNLEKALSSVFEMYACTERVGDPRANVDN